ncbi:liprin-beta-1 isoform X3 [Phymastichus coffea]|uniref:liprin-beta-1 isoform X3 n=1 Tax=Phymastichus coffea TaxID=108790 RepID=UPI00273CC8DE|nr:liprin-beta-1 isoform X3 [Phymastichus coffea]
MVATDAQSESSDAASTVKPYPDGWTNSENYDSSETTSTSEPGEDCSTEDCHLSRLNLIHNQIHCFYKSQNCLCQSCLLSYATTMALQGSVPNICAAANISHLMSSSMYNQPICSGMGQQKNQHAHNYCPMHVQIPAQKSYKSELAAHKENQETPNSANCGGNNYIGSLDRRKRRFKSKVTQDHRTKSQSNLIRYDQRAKPHYCSIQQLNVGNNSHYKSRPKTTEERLRKLENERSALHMEISILSEQVDAQSTKIIELENALQEKKDVMRQMEESLQKEVLSRSALETQKLELLTSLSEMKLRQASLEHENITLRTTSPLTNGERFSRHAGHYSSLPRPPTASKKGVAFGKTPSLSAAQSTNYLPVRGVSERCLTTPILAAEEKIINDSTSYIQPVPIKAFAEMTLDDINDWMAQLGLESYKNELKRWGATGSKLLDASHHQIEKELDIKNALHKKKLLYAVECERLNGAGFLGSEKMDNATVLRWLDDIGLPQHKEAFYNAKVDGRILHRLTTDDLVMLNITAQLHAASLRRGIQVLRELNFEFDNLERRSNNDDSYDDPEKNRNPVVLWTNHRVMEWLRVVDLAEYAPNLRGSGVHGGLMVYEPRFTSELLATLLSIPPAKTLLRRHLTTHFNQIIGRDVVQRKREMENMLGFMPLTLTARLKVPKKTQFTLKRKKSKSELDFGNLVCPMEESPPGTPSSLSTISDSEIGEQKRVISCI